MGVIQEFFNNREIAIGFWVIIGLAVILPTKPARQFIKTAIPILFCKKFVIFYIVFISFLGLVLFALNWAGFWDLTLLKDTVFWVYRGTNNSLHEDAEGVKLEIIFDTQYAPAYKQLLAEGKVRDIPVEYYRVNFRSFANPEYYVQTTARKVACIDTTKKDYGPVLSRFVSTSINEYLSEEDMTELRHAYRANRHEFTENQAVIRLNQKLQEGHSFDGKTIGLNLRESGIDEWKGDMSISLDGIPLENSGFGTQNMFKSEMAPQKILCKRYSTKSRISHNPCA